MKKKFATVIDETALLFDEICFSAGKVGYQVEMSPPELKRIVGYEFHDITVGD